MLKVLLKFMQSNNLFRKFSSEMFSLLLLLFVCCCCWLRKVDSNWILLPRLKLIKNVSCSFFCGEKVEESYNQNGS